MTIAGSDSGGGAGIQADLKVITALGGYGMTVITAVTAQNTLGVTNIQDIDVDIIEAQIEAVISDIGVDAIKIGMLSSPEIVSVVAKVLRRYEVNQIILDPVLRATSGASLGGDDTAQAMIEHLFPLANLITPNLDEATLLLGREVAQVEDFQSAAEEMMGMGVKAVLIKGGHLAGNPKQLTDYLMWQSENIIQDKAFHHRRVKTANVHGTGCTLSSAIATYLAYGLDLSESVSKSIDYVQACLDSGRFLNIGGGSGPLWHMHRFYQSSDRDELDD